MKGECKQAASILKDADDILILTHQYPDGDTLGSSGALCLALQKMGKRARVECGSIIPQKYDYMFSRIERQEFPERFVVSTDVADTQLLGDKLMRYKDKIDLCIDHHPSNAVKAGYVLVDEGAAATTEIICRVIEEMGVAVDSAIADCIYTGISTDTGCFRYTNATPYTYRVAAKMMECGADAAAINRLMFDTKSRARLEIERRVLDTMEFFYDDRCAVIYVTQKMIRESKCGDDDLDGLAALPRQVEGVLVGITLREKADGCFKISLRSAGGICASDICAKFEGGGHYTAAGCSIEGSVDEVKRKIVAAVGQALGEAK